MEQQFLKLREQTKHGNVLFPMTIYDIVSDCSLQERIYCHWHEENEFLVVTEGTGELHLNDELILITAGNIAFIPSNQIHLVTCEAGKPFSFFALVFHPNLLNSSVYDTLQQQYLDPVLRQDTLFPLIRTENGGWEREIRRLLNEIHTLFLQKDYGYELLIKARLCEAWYHCCRHALQKEKAAGTHSDYQISLVKSIIEYIRIHYEEPVSLRDLALQFHLSEGHLCRFFKSMTRMSPVEYINFYRVSMSAELLRRSDARIGEIALQTGFDNISYYNRTFRKYMHMTPSQFRRSENP